MLPPVSESLAFQAVSRLASLRHGTHVRLVSLTYIIEHPLGYHETVQLSDIPAILCDVACGETVEVAAVLVVPVVPLETGLRGAVLMLLATAEKPLKGIIVARRLGKDYQSSYFRRILATLRREGKIDNYPGQGYWLASRGTPQA